MTASELNVFQCDNCGHKPSAIEVTANDCVCIKCGDSIHAYTYDAAKMIVELEARLK